MNIRLNKKTTDKKPVVSVVICHWNGGDDLLALLNSLERQSFRDFEIIISDNNSTDDTLARVKKKYRDIKIIENGKNLGFAEGNNVAILAANGQLIFAVNQDVVLPKDYLEKIVKKFAESSRDIGVIGSKMLRFDKKTIDSAGLRISRTRRFFDIGSGELDNGQCDDEKEVFGICAAAAVYRREALDAVDFRKNGSFFEPKFFLLVEDVDLAWRIRHAGYKALYCPDIICYHKRGGADWKNRNKQYFSWRNRIFLIIRNDYFFNYFIHLPWILPYDFTRFVYMVFTNRFLWKGIYDVLAHLPSLLRERRTILKNSHLTRRESRRWSR